MKFGKEFTGQMVPEWHEAYLDYLSLKSQLKALHNFKKSQPPPINPTGLNRNPTLYRAFSGLVRVAHSPRFRKSGSRIVDDIENQAILVNHGVDGSETTFLKANDRGGEYEVVYFKRLDDEFNKVLKFYKLKVGEVMKEAHELNKQMDALVAFRVKVEHPNGSEEANGADSTATVPVNVPFASRARSKGTEMDVIDEETSVRMRQLEADSADDIKEESLHTIHEQSGHRSKRPASIEILENVRFNNTLDTPRSTIKGLLKLPNQSDMNYRKDKLKKVEMQLKKAFVEFYNKLRLLKSYCFLNMLAISKIMKKYDKITSRKASRSYMEMVDKSYLGTSDEVSMLIERVEVTFVKHFSNSNRSKGMNILKPQEKREKHRLTFSMGFLVGCTLALIVALVLIVRTRHLLDNTAGTHLYMETMFPLYSIFGFIVIHMLMYAGNIFFWRRYRVNYSFIFGFKQGTELGYKEVMVVGFCISLLAMASVLANLDMEMDPQTRDFQAITELLPLFLLVSLIGIMFCPLNIIYRSSRMFFLTSLFHCILAPLYKVTLPDFLLADQLTSQVQALRSLEFYICYYGWGDYKHRRNTCSTSDVFRTFSFIIAAVPFCWRLFQCLRRWAEEKDIMQGYNAGKFFLTIVAVSTRTAYTLTRNNKWRIIASVTSILATVISTYWDIVIDWGLLQRKAKNRWLRDKLLVPHRTIYFVAIVLNILLRLAWMQSVLNITVFSLHRQHMIFIMASLEILRRGIWNFFRLENEHLNNVGKFRAFKTVPLPFNYDEKDE